MDSGEAGGTIRELSYINDHLTGVTRRATGVYAKWKAKKDMTPEQNKVASMLSKFFTMFIGIIDDYRDV